MAGTALARQGDGTWFVYEPGDEIPTALFGPLPTDEQVLAAATCPNRLVIVTPEQVAEVSKKSEAPDGTAAFIAAMKAGGRVYVAAGRYVLNNLVLSVARQEWEFAADAVITAADYSAAPAMTIAADGVRIEGGQFANGAPKEAKYQDVGCIHVTAADDVQIAGASFSGAVGACILALGCNRLEVARCTFSDTWYTAVFVKPLDADIRGVSIKDNTVTNAATFAGYKYGFNVHNDPGALYAISDVAIVGNTLEYPAGSSDYPLPIELYGGPAVPGAISSVVISGNVVRGGGIGISLSQVVDAAVSGNTVVGASVIGIECVNGHNCSITGNTTRGAVRGISASNDSRGVTISGNAVIGASYGIYCSLLGRASHAAVVGNSVSAAGIYGIAIEGTSQFVVSGNTLDGRGTGKKAIVIDKSSGGSVAANTGSGWTENAVLVYANQAGTYDQLSVCNNVWMGTLNSLSLITQLSNGAAIGNHVSYLGNSSDLDLLYRRDTLDVKANRVEISGPNSPEGIFAAGKGSTYRRTDGGAATCWYVKESASGSTGWVGK